LLILGFDEVSLNTKFRYQLFHVTLELVYGFLQCSSVFLFFLEVLLSIIKYPLESFSKFLYIESREIYGVSVSHFWHMIITGPFFSDSMRLVIYIRKKSSVKQMNGVSSYKKFQTEK
jgi:hypothetical protein